MAKKKVLLLGIDSKLIDPNLSTATGWDANRVRGSSTRCKQEISGTGIRIAKLPP
jgi:hypothetical protein